MNSIACSLNSIVCPRELFSPALHVQLARIIISLALSVGTKCLCARSSLLDKSIAADSHSMYLNLFQSSERQGQSAPAVLA